MWPPKWMCGSAVRRWTSVKNAKTHRGRNIWCTRKQDFETVNNTALQSLYLVGSIPTPLKNKEVNWDDYSQIYGKIKKMFQTTNQLKYNLVTICILYIIYNIYSIDYILNVCIYIYIYSHYITIFVVYCHCHRWDSETEPNLTPAGGQRKTNRHQTVNFEIRFKQCKKIQQNNNQTTTYYPLVNCYWKWPSHAQSK